MRIGYPEKAGIAAICLVLLAAGVLAASVTPVLFNPWQSGNAAFECTQAGCSATYAYKVDAPAPNGNYPTGEGNTITISNSNSYTFDWSSTWPVTCVIVAGGNQANVFYYPGGAYGDTSLYAPLNPNTPDPSDTFQVSHVTFCYNGGERPPEIPALPLLAIPTGLAVVGLIVRKNREIR